MKNRRDYYECVKWQWTKLLRLEGWVKEQAELRNRARAQQGKRPSAEVPCSTQQLYYNSFQKMANSKDGKEL